MMKGSDIKNKNRSILCCDNNNIFCFWSYQYKPKKITSYTVIAYTFCYWNMLEFKGIFPDFSTISVCVIVSRYPRKNLKSKLLAYSDFASASCAIITCIDNAPLTSMLKISDPIIHSAWSFVQINRSLNSFLRFIYLFIYFITFITTKSIQNNQNSKFSADHLHKIWE